MNLKRICRLCLSSDRAMYPLFGDNHILARSGNIAIVDVLKMFTISISSDNDRPSEICITCLNILNSAYDFKLKCEKMEFPVKFMKSIKTHGICRTCLKFDEPMLSVFGVLFHLKDTMYETVSIIELLRMFYGVKINNNNKRGVSFICMSCIEEVKKIFAFKLKFEKLEKKYSRSLYSILLHVQNQIKINPIFPAMPELSSIEIKEEIFDDYNPNFQFESIIIKKEFEINFTDNTTSSKSTNNILDCGIAILDNLPAKASEEICDPLFVLDPKNSYVEMVEAIDCEIDKIFDKTVEEIVDDTMMTHETTGNEGAIVKTPKSKTDEKHRKREPIVKVHLKKLKIETDNIFDKSVEEIVNDTMMTDETTGNEDAIVKTPNIKTVEKHRKRGRIAQVHLKISSKGQNSKDTSVQYETSEECKKYSIKCPLCFIIIPTIDLLENHIKTNHTDGTSCELCYENNIIWPDHINIHYCNICFITFCGKTAVAMHRKKHKMSKFRCNICRRNCRNQEILNRHIKLGHRSVQYGCELCSFTGSNKIRLTRHMKTSHYSCRDCPKIFETLGELRQHEFEHTGQAIYQCEICSLVCNSRRHLIEHKKFHSANSAVFECKICKKIFKSKAERKAHIEEHNEKIGNLSIHKCQICSKEFTKRSEAEIHRRVHTLAFKCDFCPSTFQRKRFLCLHMKTHRNSLFPTAATRSNRKEVLKKHSIGSKRYSCEKCGRIFLAKSLLNEHLESHKDIKKDQKCTVCLGIFKSRHGLHIHSAKAHGIKY